MPAENGQEPQRKPFRDDEKIQAWKLCAKAAIAIDTCKEQLKEHQARFEKLKDAIRAGGYLVDEQGQLPLEEEDVEQEARA